MSKEFRSKGVSSEKKLLDSKEIVLGDWDLFMTKEFRSKGVSSEKNSSTP